jgi:DNA polymerase
VGGETNGMTNAEAASLLGWWLDAGVDTLVADQPRNWLCKTREPSPSPGASESIPAPAPSASTPASSSDRGDTLEAFHAYLRQASDLPLFRSGAARALPHGPAHAEIMIISDLPGRDCSAEGKPIGGEAWELTVRMLAAIGFAPDQAYVASLACFPSPGNRLGEQELARCADDMKHQVALVAPKRLLLLGDGPARALLGQTILQARGRVQRIAGIPAVATLHPRQLLQRPSDKAYAWRDLLLLMSEEVS